MNIYSNLKENVQAFCCMEKRKKCKKGNKENCIKRWQCGKIIFSSLFSPEFTQDVHILLTFLDDKNLYTNIWSELIFTSWCLYSEAHSELSGHGICYTVFLTGVGNGPWGPVDRGLWHIPWLKVFTLVSESLAWKSGSSANSPYKLELLLTSLCLSVLICRLGIIIVAISQSCCKD